MASIKNLKRMCKNIACKDCPLSGSDVSDCWVRTVPSDYPDEDIDAIVDKWATEHPIKTYAMDFFEKFPDAPKESNGIPAVCRNDIYGKISMEPWDCLTCKMSCEECWNREMEEK